MIHEKTREDFKIVQVIPVKGLKAVYFVDRGDVENTMRSDAILVLKKVRVINTRGEIIENFEIISPMVWETGIGFNDAECGNFLGLEFDGKKDWSSQIKEHIEDLQKNAERKSNVGGEI